jgi:hypothetical protein
MARMRGRKDKMGKSDQQDKDRKEKSKSDREGKEHKEKSKKMRKSDKVLRQ